jgi:hypothetical protein
MDDKATTHNNKMRFFILALLGIFSALLLLILF